MPNGECVNGQGPILAIDLGTDGIKAAICGPSGLAETIRSDHGARRTNSALCFAADGSVVLGEEASEQAQVSPEDVAVEWKMELANQAKRFIRNTMNAEEIATLAIKIIVERAEKQTGQKISRLVLTIPANFPDQGRAAAIRAAEAGGFEVVQVITEPGAVGLAYCVKKQVECIICVDVGAGTTDVSVLEVENGIAAVKATGGVARLGGRDFTAAVVDLLIEKMSADTGKSITRESFTPEQVAELEAKAEKAKIALGMQPATKVALRVNNDTKLVEITQEEFERATQAFTKQILACVDQVKTDAQKEWGDFDMLAVAGGACESPRVQLTIADHTGLVAKAEIDPAIVVSHGAALHAHNLLIAEGAGKVIPNRPVLQEATGHDIGVAVEDETKDERPLACDVVVPKNKPVPGEFSTEYRLLSETATEAFIEILQGPQDAPIDKCSKIGVIHLQGLPRETLRTYRIVVIFKFDNNTLCEATARDKISGISQTVSVKLTHQKDQGETK